MKPLRQTSQVAHYSNDDEPIYENLNKYEPPRAKSNKSKQYSVKDVFSSLKSLERDADNEEDLLCDKEVDFYLNRNSSGQYFSFNSYLNSQLQPKPRSKLNTGSCKSTMNRCSNNRPVALWEQLV